MQVQMVEIDPEGVDTMQSRFARALEHVYDCRIINWGGITPPEVKANVFDWHDGLRLVVCRKRHHARPHSTFLHVSAGVSSGQLYDQLMRMMQTMSRACVIEWFKDLARQRYLMISADLRFLDFVSINGPGIINFVIEEQS